jgi:predicted nucleic acid-binding Zn finger protein
VQIVDHRGVFAFEGEVSKRRVFQVVGHKSTDRYTVFPGHYCSCHSFFFDVVNKNESVYCKHQLAVKLSEALQHTRTTVVNDLVIAEILQS